MTFTLGGFEKLEENVPKTKKTLDKNVEKFIFKLTIRFFVQIEFFLMNSLHKLAPNIKTHANIPEA